MLKFRRLPTSCDLFSSKINKEVKSLIQPLSEGTPPIPPFGKGLHPPDTAKGGVKLKGGVKKSFEQCASIFKF